jgi:hypothetical protein
VKWLIPSLLAAAALTGMGGRVQTDPLTCAGYPEPRVFLEAQAWWLRTPGENGTSFGHLHMGACVPYQDDVRGNVHLDIVAKMHMNPGTTADSYEQIATDAGDTTDRLLWKGSLACSTGDCTFVIPVDIPTTDSPYDGMQEFKPRLAVLEPDGNKLRASLRFPAYIANGKPVNDYSKGTTYDFPTANPYGWYSVTGYAAIYCYFPPAVATLCVPGSRTKGRFTQQPVRGTWNVTLSFRSFGNSNSGANVTHYFVSVDPSWHSVPPYPGVVVADANTSCAPEVYDGCDGPTKKTFAINTTTLANGPHRLFFRTDERDPRGSTLSGAGVVPFTVAN